MNCPHCTTSLHPASFAGRFNLTPREAEVADLIVAGNRNDSISIKLGISEATVKTHVGRVLHKAHVSSRVGLVRIAFGLEAV